LPAAAPTLFVSDLHLAPARANPLAAFHRFAQGPARRAAALYVLGDLFDWWIGDDQLREPYARDVAAALGSVAAAGVPVYFARGNRDFLAGERFARAAGATLLGEVTRIDVDGEPILVLHGDELCTDDVEYQAYRQRIRSPQSVARLLALPPLARRGIAWWLRHKSRNATALKPESITDVAAGAVADAFRAHGVRRMIHGHTHRPARHRVDVDGVARERIVLADWHDRGHVLALERGEVSTYDIDG
jgi:UDP-2,3-diacylglucosamine hydrolase